MKLALAFCFALALGAESVAESVVVVSFRDGVEQAEADEILLSAGLTLMTHPDLLPNQRLVRGPAERMRNITSRDEVIRTFVASPELIAGLPVQSCAQPALEVRTKSAFKAAVAAEGWGRDATLAWSVAKYPDTMTAEQVDEILARALGEWTRNAGVRFTRTAKLRAVRSIEFVFGSGDHGDGYPFPAGRTVLAHAFYPATVNPEPIAGDVHLNSDASWSTGGIHDLYSAALHEIGHALGLAHSATPGSVMYPWYQRLTELGDEDVRDLQSLYGPPAAVRLSLTVSGPQATASDFVDLTGTVSGDSADVTVLWTANSAAGTAQGGRSWRAASIPLVPGTNTITLTAVTLSGETDVRTFAVTRSQEPASVSFPEWPSQPPTPQPDPASSGDRVAPTLSITSPSASVFVTSQPNVRISGTGRDNAGLREITWESATGSGNAEGTSVWTATVPLLNGDNTVIIRARDEAGNTSWRSLLIVRR